MHLCCVRLFLTVCRCQTFLGMFRELVKRMRISNLVDSSACLGNLRTMASLCKIRPAAIALTSASDFRQPNADPTARDLEIWSLLGPYFRLTSTPDDSRVPEHYFPNIMDLSERALHDKMSEMRELLTHCHKELHEIVLTLLRHKETKNAYA
jgi:hypothetical protein